MYGQEIPYIPDMALEVMERLNRTNLKSKMYLTQVPQHFLTIPKKKKLDTKRSQLENGHKTK